ncbi:uncharacterized protein LOC123313134 isoform X2 [Coccinella septempunctata]|uniref:uncharacterized protein LOC123313134 isoform X2 n=1 Tax=Coccinella septempunctata TaxID=41139 RepID=UPI001D090E3B|nr:uncharacterized protein LOC123313134 isoform X2 [Coccinella septempunctata]
MEGRRGEFTDENNNVYNYCQRSYSNVRQNEPGSDTSLREHIVSYQTESFHFLQDMGMIPKSTHCSDCNRSMNWNFSGTVDLFEWICPGCRKSCPIKQCSPLEDIDCSYDKILGVIWAWCNSEEIDKTAFKFGIESKTVMNIFSIAGLAAEKHITRYTSQWNIGGPGVIVLIDTFPETFLSGSRQSNRPILCLAELKANIIWQAMIIYNTPPSTFLICAHKASFVFHQECLTTISL